MSNAENLICADEIVDKTYWSNFKKAIDMSLTPVVTVEV